MSETLTSFKHRRTAVRNLNYDLKMLCRHNRDGSRSTQHDRERVLTQMANDLRRLGYGRMRGTSLKTKHVDALVKDWQSRELSVGTMKNRMAVVRWWAEKVDKRNVVARRNDHYGIGERSHISRESRAKELDRNALERVRDVFVRFSLELQRLFGFRREEAIKFNPSYADRGDHIVLRASWCKGGKERVMPIRNEAQRVLLDRVRQAAGSGSLIPSEKRYVDQLRLYERQTAEAGLSRMHGLRHAYAQERYRELTGWDCPLSGGPDATQLSEYQRLVDREARLEISRELGHEREQITTTYLGR